MYRIQKGFLSAFELAQLGVILFTAMYSINLVLYVL